MPDQGGIYIDNNKIDANNISKYSELFSYIPQKIGVLNDNVFVNISLSDDINNTEIKNNVINSMKAASFYDNNKVEFDLDRHIGEDAINISGGQAQRLAIARAYFFKRAIIVLDEATSALDAETESNILDELLNSKDITVIHITHKKSLEQYDKVIMLNNGSIKLK